VIFLHDGVVCAAVVAWNWVCDGHGLSIGKGESLIEIWAVLEASDVGSNILCSNLLFVELVVSVAVEANLWEWNGLALTIGEGKPLIEVWAMLEAVD
jgi:hypothetical protein